MNNKKIFLTFLITIFTFFLLYLIYTFTNKQKNINYSSVNNLQVNDNFKWSKEKKNLLIIYSDYQCPACKTMEEFLKTFESSNSPNFVLTKKITLIYRHFPLYQIHQNAFSAAYAAEAAGLQNKFWPMTDLLFKNQNYWSHLNNPENYFIQLAKKLNLDLNQFKKDLQSEKVINKVKENLKQAQDLELRGTPTFILNGKKLEFDNLNDFVLKLKNL